MNQTEGNKQTIADYLNEGCTQRQEFQIGMELEHFVLKRNRKNVSYEELTGVMHKMMESGVPSYDEEGFVKGFFNEEFAVSLKAAAQLEVRIFPQESIAQVQKIYEKFVKKFQCVTKKDGYTLETFGYQPIATADTLKLVPNRRYEYMNAYFKETGPFGVQMMRATANTRVSIDYEDEKDYIRKFRLACVLSPILSLLTDNAPVYEGQPYNQHLLRERLMGQVDASRCGIPEGIFDKTFGFDRYAEYIYTRQPILIFQDGETKILFRQTADAYYADKELKKTEAAYLLDTVFPQVRTKQYIEICCADSMPQEYAIAFTALIKGIFYNESSLREMEETFTVLQEREITDARDALVREGYQASVYGIPADAAAKKVVAAAKRGLPVQEEAFLEPLEELVEQRCTLAELAHEMHQISC
ncbi:MAG: glutamate-cysteine ligase family protein [Lachnospiraceae bacterium]